MARSHRTSVFSVVAGFALAACAIAPSPNFAPTPATADPSTVAPALVASLNAALEAGLASLGAPGAQAAVIFDDGATWVGAAGRSADDRAMTAELLMPIASVSKVYTAVLVLMLVDEGRISLDDPVAKWLPASGRLGGVTIRQLLTHTGGVASDDPGLALVCDPGTCFSYSNGGYQLLGQVVEAVTGSTYAAALRERILSPHGLNSTFYPRQEVVRGEEAVGHRGDEAASTLTAATFGEGPGWAGASGGIVATAEDAARFADALFRGRILSEAGLHSLMGVEATLGLPGTIDCEAQAMLNRRGTAYGETSSHGGNAGWFRSWLEHYPAHGMTVVVLVNADPFPGPIADGLVAAALVGVTGTAPGGHCEDAIAIRSPDGNVHRLPDEPGYDGMPTWSPDGGQLAWLTFRDGRADVVIAHADGSAARSLTDDDAAEVRIAWSPDGERVAFSAQRDGDFDLYVVHLSDGATTQLTNNAVDDWLPAWSPDGRHLAYIRTDAANQLRILDVDGGADRAVEGPDGGVWWPAWAPDSSRLAYESGGVIYMVPAAGGEPSRLAVNQLRVVRFPSWAPASDLLFASDGDLYSASPDGSNLRRLTETSTNELTPTWAPDEATIAFQVSYWVDGVR